jgi:hypothetical protein
MWARKGGRVQARGGGAYVIGRALRDETMSRYGVPATATARPSLDNKKRQSCRLLYHGAHFCQERRTVPSWGGSQVRRIGLAHAVDHRGIDPVDAELQRTVDRRDGIRIVLRA